MIGFYIFKGLLKKQQYVPETVCGSQSLKYLITVPLQKEFADPWSKYVIL